MILESKSKSCSCCTSGRCGRPAEVIIDHEWLWFAVFAAALIVLWGLPSGVFVPPVNSFVGSLMLAVSPAAIIRTSELLHWRLYQP